MQSALLCCHCRQDVNDSLPTVDTFTPQVAGRVLSQHGLSLTRRKRSSRNQPLAASGPLFGIYFKLCATDKEEARRFDLQFCVRHDEKAAELCVHHTLRSCMVYTRVTTHKRGSDPGLRSVEVASCGANCSVQYKPYTDEHEPYVSLQPFAMLQRVGESKRRVDRGIRMRMVPFLYTCPHPFTTYLSPVHGECKESPSGRHSCRVRDATQWLGQPGGLEHYNEEGEVEESSGSDDDNDDDDDEDGIASADLQPVQSGGSHILQHIHRSPSASGTELLDDQAPPMPEMPLAYNGFHYSHPGAPAYASNPPMRSMSNDSFMGSFPASSSQNGGREQWSGDRPTVPSSSNAWDPLNQAAVSFAARTLPSPSRDGRSLPPSGPRGPFAAHASPMDSPHSGVPYSTCSGPSCHCHRLQQTNEALHQALRQTGSALQAALAIIETVLSEPQSGIRDAAAVLPQAGHHRG